jgi:hypothetical protein
MQGQAPQITQEIKENKTVITVSLEKNKRFKEIVQKVIGFTRLQKRLG